MQRTLKVGRCFLFNLKIYFYSRILILHGWNFLFLLAWVGAMERWRKEKRKMNGEEQPGPLTWAIKRETKNLQQIPCVLQSSWKHLLTLQSLRGSTKPIHPQKTPILIMYSRLYPRTTQPPKFSTITAHHSTRELQNLTSFLLLDFIVLLLCIPSSAHSFQCSRFWPDCKDQHFSEHCSPQGRPSEQRCKHKQWTGGCRGEMAPHHGPSSTQELSAARCRASVEPHQLGEREAPDYLPNPPAPQGWGRAYRRAVPPCCPSPAGSTLLAGFLRWNLSAREQPPGATPSKGRGTRRRLSFSPALWNTDTCKHADFNFFFLPMKHLMFLSLWDRRIS